MKEVTLMNPSKETDNKLRWQSDVDGVKFKLYIPKWRVPRPWPVHIIVSIRDLLGDEGSQSSSRLNVRSGDAAPLEEPITAIVSMVKEHTETVRFTPRDDPKEWEIGEPYIPYSLLPDGWPQTIQIEVRWDRSAGTWSDE
ncbi:MAG: hypothetical protein ACLQBA_04980 [Candidatus Binataceae bacterium]